MRSEVVSSEQLRLWREQLFSAKYIIGPMVDQSELPFRLLCRKYGAQLCYSPMFNAGIFVKDHKYRRDNLVTCAYDRPLIVQFCCNDAKTFLEAARMAAPYCDAIDLNIGCPQSIAKRGHYGAFLEDEWNLLFEMINLVHTELDLPVTCKIRVFADIEKTVKYAKMLESAGCQLIAVHGRTKEQKGPFSGLASWEHIKAIKQNVRIPVFANGNIQSLADVEECFRLTGVDGVMSAVGVLHNPALFTGIHFPVWILAEEYLNLAEQYPCSFSYIRGHLFKILHHCLQLDENLRLRELLAKANSMKHLYEIVNEIKSKYDLNESQECEMSTLPVPVYLCQPFYRPPPAASLLDSAKDTCETTHKRKTEESSNDAQVSKRLQRKERKLGKTIVKVNEKKSKVPICVLCPNPKGLKCSWDLCKSCCRKKSYSEVLDCTAHRFMFKSKHEKKVNEESLKSNTV
ncbi:tRNA-dihydrouridine(16/17) synthase-like [NAD(P)(+)] protein [Leptotrombidium deliense]|uniref:tRNA-dihydrouridine(16/17) synthase [NAD(P)(+)] n=1 Tax=Leptotrombidium deliense TaxID=299467 RepID=A0A443SBL6_9ACAR|nr:tRNA-dihydrouridine(16/17) synthase-like [NAD(P)(+)] protein [Leptotrombidium deliense]